jgi:hypothetical protein
MLNSNFPYQHQRELLIKLSDFTDLNVCLNLLNFDIANCKKDFFNDLLLVDTVCFLIKEPQHRNLHLK